MVDDLDDARRTEPAYVLDERLMLEAWLEFHRTTLLLKCEGLDDAARTARPVRTSQLSLHGLVRHMAEVERNWFRRVLLTERDAPYIWADSAVEDSELVPLDGDDWAADLAAWQEESATPVGRQPRPTSSTTPASGAGGRARCGGSTCT